MSTSSNQYRTSQVCVDVHAEGVPDTETNISGAVMYFTEVICTGISCPPYQDGSELTCVVCTK